jgi:hypothetical protein
MGDPAELTEQDRLDALSLARDIVASVVDDRAFPITGLSDVDQGRVLMLAQELIRTTAEGA